MIDCAKDTLLTLAEAAKMLPRRRRSRKPHVSTLYRWTVSGCRGVILESIQIGGTRATSLEALQRFFERLSHRREAGENPSGSRSLVQRRRASEHAEIELKKLGV